MRYTQYGKTDKLVSVVGFGGMRFDQRQSDEQNAALLRHAHDLGINYFDTAPGYGRSEDIFGRAFRGMKQGFYVSTKAMPTQVATAAKARKAVQSSLQRMGLEKIDFFHVWCLRKMEHFQLAIRPGGLYEGLLRCQQEGLVDHIVCSTHQPGSEIREVVASGRFEGVTLGINVLNHAYRWEGVQAAQEAGLGVVAMNPLGGGLIPQHETQFNFLSSPGESPTEAALRFVIACEPIHVALVGFSNAEQIDVACRIADQAVPLSEEHLAKIRSRLGQKMASACTACGYCRHCPEQIPVPAYMQFYNLKAVFGRTDAQMQRAIEGQHTWGLLAGRRAEAKNCTQCGTCEEACTQHLNIISRLQEIAAWEKAQPCRLTRWLRRARQAALRRVKQAVARRLR